MKLLSQQEAIQLIQLSWKDVERYNNTIGSYRFGKALCDNLPINLYTGKDAGITSEMDFYYETNCDKVLEKFYRYYVETA